MTPPSLGVIVRVILRSRRWTVCGEAENGQPGVEEFHRLKPDVVLLDLSLPDISGTEAAELMSATNPTVPLILFTILEVEGIDSAALRTESIDLTSRHSLMSLRC